MDPFPFAWPIGNDMTPAEQYQALDEHKIDLELVGLAPAQALHREDALRAIGEQAPRVQQKGFTFLR
jgi:hypothetical protein